MSSKFICDVSCVIMLVYSWACVNFIITYILFIFICYSLLYLAFCLFCVFSSLVAGDWGSRFTVGQIVMKPWGKMRPVSSLKLSFQLQKLFSWFPTAIQPLQKGISSLSMQWGPMGLNLGSDWKEVKPSHRLVSKQQYRWITSN